MKNSVRYDNKLNVIGSVIRDYREKCHLSQADVSSKLLLLGIDIPKNSFQRLECGDRIIKDYELAGISKVLGVSPNLLLKDFIKELV